MSSIFDRDTVSIRKRRDKLATVPVVRRLVGDGSGPAGPAGPPGPVSATNLGYISASRTVTSDTGSDVILPLADAVFAGLMTAADFVKLSGLTGPFSGGSFGLDDGTASASGNFSMDGGGA